MTNLTFGQKLMILRRNKHLSQRKLAELIKTGVANIARYELDSSLPGALTLIKLSDFFDVSIDYLLKSSGPGSSVKDPQVALLMSKIDDLDSKNRAFIIGMVNSFISSQNKSSTN